MQTPVDPDAFLTDVTIFWFTGPPARPPASTRSRASLLRRGAGRRPTAVAVFPGDGAVARRSPSATHVVRWTRYPRGGHFASLQAPDLLLEDIRAFTAELVTGPAR